MEKNKSKIIEEEIRQYKLFKIQVVEGKIREYEKVFNAIKEGIVFRFTKNATAVLLIIAFSAVSFALLVFGISLLFPEQMVRLLENSGETLSRQENDLIVILLPFFGYANIALSILFASIAWLLKKNIHKRKTVFRLSTLVREVIDYMDANVKEDKKKYEYFVDSVADIEQNPTFKSSAN